MSKCPKCGVDVEVGAKFCGECGTEIPQTKECPKCHAQWPQTMKFCGECGHRFNAASSVAGTVIGDKNVIAGDVHINQSSTVTNIVQSEGPKSVLCNICSRPILETDSYKCPICGKNVCVDHFSKNAWRCVSCVKHGEEELRDMAIALASGGGIGDDELVSLKQTAESLKIDDAQMTSIVNEVKAKFL